jgi:hypothetical protein
VNAVRRLRINAQKESEQGTEVTVTGIGNGHDMFEWLIERFDP